MKKNQNKTCECYLREIGKIPLLAKEEEIELAKRIKKGDQEALEKLTTANLRFVVSICKEYRNRGLSMGDLINEGNLGLLKAAKRFDETRGFKFISYAVWWIRQSILQALSEQLRVVRLPVNRVGALNKITRAHSHLEQEFEREPALQEIAEHLRISPAEISKNLIHGRTHLSLDAPCGLVEDSRLMDVIADEEQPPVDDHLHTESLKQEIEIALNTLTEREAKIIKLYYGLEEGRALNLEEIGIQFHLTRERIRQIKEKALRKLRHQSRSRPLKHYISQV